MWLFLFLSLSTPFLSSLLLSLPLQKSSLRQAKGCSLVSLTVRPEQDFQIKPCHRASHWAFALFMTSADSCAAAATSNLKA